MLNSLSHLSSSLWVLSPLLVPGSRRSMPHIPASSAVTSGALPAPFPQLSSLPAPASAFLTCLIYLFNASLNVSAWPHLCLSCARTPHVSGLTVPHPTPHVCVCFLPFWPCHPPSLQLWPPTVGPKGVLYIGMRCGVLPRPSRGGVLYICNIQSIVKNLFKAPQGRLHDRTCGSRARRGPLAGPTSTFYCAWA